MLAKLGGRRYQCAENGRNIERLGPPSSVTLMRLALALALLLPAFPARAETLVSFDAMTTPPAAVRGLLARPPGAGPFPAVLLLHSCLGLPGNRRVVEDALTGAGYVALIVDDFSTRGLTQTCTVEFPEALGDALGASEYLSRQDFVDKSRIAAVGFSQGGDTALRIAASPEHGFRAAAAFYPPCANLEGEKLAIPTLILIGERDNVTPAADCEAFAEAQRGKAKLVVYPGAYHVFDDPVFAGGAERFGMHLQYGREAAEKSRVDLLRFLRAELGRAGDK
jgi:dienelactone hydrolase